MIRSLGAVCALIALGACQPPIPDSAAGIGFDRDDAGAPRNSALPPAQAVSQETIPEAPVVTSVPIAAPAQTTTATLQPAAAVAAAAPLATTTTAAAPATSEAQSIATETTAALAAATANSGVLPVDASPSNPAPKVFSNPGISDENDFNAVGERRSIEDDAARRAQNKANYTLIQPTAVPQRTGAAGPNIVAYALSTNHARGTKMYSRFGLNSAKRYEKACARYSSDEAAQLAFLEKGGPKSDRLGVDPDGDGFACQWDPSAFRKAAGN